MYGEHLAAYLTGVTVSQLQRLRRNGTLVPEVSAGRPPIYSFRDLAALRTIAQLRAETSAQRIAKAFGNLSAVDLYDHPSNLKFTVEGGEIWVQGTTGKPISLAKRPGDGALVTFEDVEAPFTNFKSREVVAFRKPSEFLELNPRRMGGVPTVVGTRVDLFTVLANVDRDDPDSIEEFLEDYEQVSADAVRDVLDFDYQVHKAV